MKRKATVLSACVLAVGMSLSALAAGGSLIAPIASPVQDGAAVRVNGQELEGTVKVVDGCVMVPMREVFEELGFEVEWNADSRSVHAANGERETNVTIGEDSYYAYSTNTLGMTAPTALGSAPALVDSKTYIPAQLFRILFGNRADAVVLEDGAVAINEEAQADVELPTPYTLCDSLEDVGEIVGFDVEAPEKIGAYEIEGLLAYRGIGLADVRYTDGENTVSYRVSKGEADNSGDYNRYDNSRILSVGETAVSCRGNGDTVSVATWTEEGKSFSLRSDAPVSEAVLAEMVGALR